MVHDSSLGRSNLKTSRVPIIISLAFFVAFLLPIFYLYYGAYLFGQGGIDFAIFSQEWTPLINTLETGIGAATLSTSLGAIYAWVVARTDVPGKRVLGSIPLLALTMPLLTKGFAWIFLFSPRIGLVNAWLMQLLHLGSPPFDIFGMWGIIFATGLGGMPLAYLIMRPALDSFDPSLEESSRIAGNSPFRTFTRVTLPGILPAVASVFVLLFIDAMSLLDYALILGEPVNYNTLATQVDYYATDHIPPEFGVSATIGVEYIFITLALVTFYVWLTRKSFTFSVITGKASRETVNKLRKWKIPAFLLCFGIFAFAFILPFITLLFMSFANSYTFIKGQILASYSLLNWEHAVKLPLLWNSFYISIFFAVMAGVLSTIVALFLSLGFLKSRVRGARFLEYVSYMPFVIPGIVYGLALFWTFLFLPGVSNVLYGTIWPMVIAVTFIYLPKSVRMISANLVQVSNELEESPRVVGLGWWRTLLRVDIPLIKGGLINSFLYTFVDSIRELGAVILLTTSSTIVLDVLLLEIWTSQANSLGLVSAASVIVTLFIGGVLLVAEIINPSRKRSTITEVRKKEVIQEEIRLPPAGMASE